MDIGCGYGGLLCKLFTKTLIIFKDELSKLYPEKLSLGIEIRDKVVEYSCDKLVKERKENYENVK